MTKQNTTEFYVFYDGESHKSHEIDITTLGKSLTALGEVLKESNKIINGESSAIDVSIKADFIPGSFGYLVEIYQNIINYKDIAVQIGLIAGVCGVTALAVIDWLKGDEITIIEDNSDGTKKIIVDSRSIDCDEDIAKLVENGKIRNALADIIHKPLQNPGTTSFYIKKTRDCLENDVFIDKQSSSAYVPLKVHQVETTETYEAVVKFIAANIMKQSGWKAIINGKEEFIKMEDEFFIERLSNMQEPHIFGKSFTVSLRTTKINKLNMDKFKYAITRVHHENLLA